LGNLPSNSGIRSLGLLLLKAPAQIKRIWPVLISPNLVLTNVPSIKGNKSLCTPSVDGDLPDAVEAWEE